MRIPQDAAAPPRPRARAWCRDVWTSRTALTVVLLVALAVTAMGAAWADMVRIAAVDEEQSHAFLVPVVAAWLVWIRRERLRRYVPTARWWGPVLVASGWALNAYGDLHHVEAAWHLGAVVVAVGALVTVVGAGILTRFLPAFAALVFLVPVPASVRQSIAIPLQERSAAAAQIALETFGADVGRNGNLLTINGEDVLIAEACNGLRMVFALVLVSFAFAYGVPFRNWFRFCVVALSPLTAIVFNVVRLVPTIWAFGSVSHETALTLHDVGGWLMLPLAFLTLMGVMRVLRWAQIPVTPYVLAYGS